MKVKPKLAISIRQPWAWLIIHAGKDIENRSWYTSFRGYVYIHASKSMTHSEYDIASNIALGVNNKIIPDYEKLERGGLIGIVEIVDCVRTSQSPWFVGKYGFVLKNVSSIPFQACKGKLGFFKAI